MNASFDVNWMRSSFIVYENDFLKLKFEIETGCDFLTKFVLNSSFPLYFNKRLLHSLPHGRINDS